MPEKSQGLEDLLLALAGKPQPLRLGEAGSEQKSAPASCSFLCNSPLLWALQGDARAVG